MNLYTAILGGGYEKELHTVALRIKNYGGGNIFYHGHLRSPFALIFEY